MKKVLFFCFFIIIGLNTQAQRQITWTKDVGQFVGISASSTFKIEVTKGNVCSVELEVSEDLKDAIKVEVVKGVLTLQVKNLVWTSKKNKELKARITLPDLRYIELTGASSAIFSGEFSTTKPCEIELSGASSVNKLNIITPKLSVEVSGASSLDVRAKASIADLEISGASSVNFISDQFKIKNLSCEVSGASNLYLSADAAKVKIDASGASNSIFSGTWDEQDLSASGMSTIDIHKVNCLNTKSKSISGQSTIK